MHGAVGEARDVEPLRGLVLGRDGELFDAVMRRHNISRLDVEEALRDNGLGKVAEAALITLEVDGTITVIPRK